MFQKDNWIFYIGICCIVIVTNFEFTIVNLAIPSIAKSLFLSLSQVQSILSLYLLGAIVSFLIFGHLCNRYGKLRIYRLGIALFFFGTALCGGSISKELLMLGRFIQGVGFAASFSIALSLIRSCFSPERIPFFLGCTTMISGLSQALGPTTGAWIVTKFSWPMIFLMKLPFIALAFLLTFSEKTSEKTDKVKLFDIKGAVTWTLSVSLLYLMTEVSSVSMKVALIGFCSLLFAATFLQSKKRENSFLPTALFQDEGFRLGSFIRVLSVFYFSSLLFLLSLYLQNIEGRDIQATALLFLFMSSCYALSSLLYGMIESKRSVPAWSSPLFLSISLAFLFFYAFVENLLLLYVGLALAGIHFGIAMPQSLNLSLKSIQEKEHGKAMSLFCSIGFLSSMLSLVIVAFLLEGSCHIHLQEASNEIPIEEYRKAACGLTYIQELPKISALSVKSSFKFAMNAYFLLMGVLSFGAVFMLARWDTKKLPSPSSQK